MSYLTKIVLGSNVFLNNDTFKPVDSLKIGDDLVSYIPSDLKINQEDIELIKDSTQSISHSLDEFPAKGQFISNRIKSINIIKQSNTFIKINENINNNNSEMSTLLDLETHIYTNRGWLPIVDSNKVEVSDCYLNWKNRWKVIYEITDVINLIPSIDVYEIETEYDNILLESFIVKQ